MARASIPVDLFNPGQVFACLGFLEATSLLGADARGAFEWSNEADVRFHLDAGGAPNPFETVLAFLSQAEVSSTAPHDSVNATGRWNVPTRRLDPGSPFPYPDPDSPATLPALLTVGERTIAIEHWGDATVRNNVKFWAGAGGYPGAALARDTLDLIRSAADLDPNDPFATKAPQTSSFRFDWRRDYIPLDAGFSPNQHSNVTMIGYPVVEILAAIGLSNARPQRIDKLHYRYGVIRPPNDAELLDPNFLRAALGCPRLPFESRTFAMRLGWPGQENQGARCITDVVEEPRR